MLQQEQRLRKSSEFSVVYNIKQSLSNSLLILYVSKETHKKDRFPKVGFVVSKKIHKRAVKRNRIKRLMRESYQIYCKKNETTKHWQRLIFISRNAALEADFSQMSEAVENLIKRAEKKFVTENV